MLKRLMLLALATTVAAAVTTTPVHAQRRARRSQVTSQRDGFWIGFGVGTGSIGVDCFQCADDRSDGFSGYFRAGGTINRNWLVGGEANGWTHSSDGIDESLGFATFIAVWYPSAWEGFFLKGGIGAMSYRTDDGIDEIKATAPAGSFGLGYDIPVTRTFALTPYLNLMGSSTASFHVNGVAAPSRREIKLNLVQVGLGMHWQ